jgi:hypothetical protein
MISDTGPSARGHRVVPAPWRRENMSLGPTQQSWDQHARWNFRNRGREIGWHVPVAPTARRSAHHLVVAAIWALTPGIAHSLSGLSNPPSVAAVTTTIVVVQTIIGLLGLWIAGTEVKSIIKGSTMRHALATVWSILLHGEIRPSTPPRTGRVARRSVGRLAEPGFSSKDGSEVFESAIRPSLDVLGRQTLCAQRRPGTDAGWSRKRRFTRSDTGAPEGFEPPTFVDAAVVR